MHQTDKRVLFFSTGIAFVILAVLLNNPSPNSHQAAPAFQPQTTQTRTADDRPNNNFSAYQRVQASNVASLIDPERPQRVRQPPPAPKRLWDTVSNTDPGTRPQAPTVQVDVYISPPSLAGIEVRTDPVDIEPPPTEPDLAELVETTPTPTDEPELLAAVDQEPSEPYIPIRHNLEEADFWLPATRDIKVERSVAVRVEQCNWYEQQWRLQGHIGHPQYVDDVLVCSGSGETRLNISFTTTEMCAWELVVPSTVSNARLVPAVPPERTQAIALSHAEGTVRLVCVDGQWQQRIDGLALAS
ncbi:MAG: hypothetical protein AAF529_05375 [Pseudomonadota bacterium]